MPHSHLGRRAVNSLGRARALISYWTPAVRSAEMSAMRKLEGAEYHIPPERLQLGPQIGAGGQGRVLIASYDGNQVRTY